MLSGPRSRLFIVATAVALPAVAQNEQFVPQLVYRTGAYAPNGIPVANGIADYHIYDKGKGYAPKWDETGEILYVRGLINAMLGVEAIRTAQERFGKKPMTGEQVRWGLENLDLTAERLKELGFENELQPIKVSCSDHEGTRTGRIQTWDGKKWNIASDWITADDSIIAPMVKDAAAKYAGGKEDHARMSRDELTSPARSRHGAAWRLESKVVLSGRTIQADPQYLR
jgi:hypothetical protein